MHIDRWVKGSVLIAVVAGVPGWVSMFRPTAVIVQQPSAITEARPALDDKGADPNVNRTQLFFETMRYVGPIVSSAFIALAAFLAFRKPVARTLEAQPEKNGRLILPEPLEQHQVEIAGLKYRLQKAEGTVLNLTASLEAETTRSNRYVDEIKSMKDAEREMANRHQREMTVRQGVHSRPAPKKLKIHAAFYGTGQLNDVDVSEKLLANAMDGLVIPVENNFLVDVDPAPGKTKRIRVVYSYGNDAIWEIARPEGTRLILPEDSELMKEKEDKHHREIIAMREDHAEEMNRRLVELHAQISSLRASSSGAQ